MGQLSKDIVRVLKDKELTIKEIAEYVGCHEGSVRNLIPRLTASGEIKRSNDWPARYSIADPPTLDSLNRDTIARIANEIYSPYTPTNSTLAAIKELVKAKGSDGAIIILEHYIEGIKQADTIKAMSNA